MEDMQLINLYFDRSEAAISETAGKYGNYLKTIARNVLHNEEDTEECVNDAYLATWNAIPPARPQSLKAFIGKIARNIALNRYEKENAEKRGGGNVSEALDEFSEIISARETVESAYEAKELTKLINSFLGGIDPEKRKIFVRRYWYLSSIEEIADDYGFGKSKVKTDLMRVRNNLKEYLEKEGFNI